MSALHTRQDNQTQSQAITGFRKRTIGTAMFLMTAGIATLFSPATEAAEPLVFSSQQIANLGIATAPIKKITQYPSETYPAEAVVPLSQTHLVTTPISGLVTKIDHVHGPINKGEVIAEILSPDLLNAQKNYLNTLSDLDTAKNTLARALKLTQNGVVSVKNKQRAQADVNKLSQIKRQQRDDLTLMGMAEASIKKLEKTHKQQPAIIHVFAPVTGELFNLQVKVGQRLTPNQPLISIGIINPIVVHVKVPAQEASNISEGMKTELLNSDDNLVKQGVVAHISSFVDPMTQSIEIHNKFDNTDKKIHPGQLFQIEFIHKAKPEEHIYQAPASAIANFNQQDVVFLMQQRQITVKPVQILLQKGSVMVFKTKTPIDTSKQIITQSTSAVKTALLAASESAGGEE